MAPRQIAKTDNAEKTSLIRELKFPLNFYGLSLLVTESAFTTVILGKTLSETGTIELAAMMFGLFVIAIGAVTGLVWWTPEHLKLLPQAEEQAKALSSSLIDLLRAAKATDGQIQGDNLALALSGVINAVKRNQSEEVR